MKKLSLCLLLTVFVNNVFSQGAIDSRNGYRLPANGIFRVFVVFAEVTGDPYESNPSSAMAGWSAGQMPDNPAGYIDAQISTNYQGYLSRYFDEISFGALKVLGDYHNQLIQIPYTSFIGNSAESLVICNGQQIQTVRGFSFPEDFDLWNLRSSSSSPPWQKLWQAGQVWQNVKDDEIDCIMIIWRINSKFTMQKGSGNFSLSSSTAIGNKTKTSIYGRVYPDGFPIVRHEFAHGLVGPNSFHSSYGTGANCTYMQSYSGYSILSGNSKYMSGYNAWDRYRLGWKNPQHLYEISARSESGQEVNTDLDYILQSQASDSIVYILRDFSTFGDAVRVKLPYIHTLNPSAKE